MSVTHIQFWVSPIYSFECHPYTVLSVTHIQFWVSLIYSFECHSYTVLSVTHIQFWVSLTCWANLASSRKGLGSFSHPVDVDIIGGSIVITINPFFSASNKRKNNVRSLPVINIVNWNQIYWRERILCYAVLCVGPHTYAW